MTTYKGKGKKKRKNWKGQANKNWNGRRYAWARYFEEFRNNHDINLQTYETLQPTIIEIESKVVDKHLVSVIKDLYRKAKERVQCCVCLDVIKAEDLEIKVCGHILHKTPCWSGIVEHTEEGKYPQCPICRQ
jgi:hypothetical protein